MQKRIPPPSQDPLLSFLVFRTLPLCQIDVLAIVLGFILDDWLVNLLGISHSALYGTLLASGVAIAVGCIVLVGYLL